MAQRMNNSNILANNNNNGLTFRDIILDTKPDPRTGKTSKKVRLIGEPIGYMEYSARTKDATDLNEKGYPKIKAKDFPDKDQRKALTRIGNDDPEKCYWAKNGYIGSRKFAQNCLERLEDGTYSVRILNKGATVFKPLAEWQSGKLEEKLEDDSDDICTFLGGRIAPEARVTCHMDPKAPGGVRYEVNILSKNKELTEEEIEALKAAGCPSDEDLKKYRKEYEERMEGDPYLPPFEDFFEYGHNLRNIFKYTPPAIDSDDDEDDKPASKTPKAKSAHVDDDEEDEAPRPKASKKAAKNDDDDDDDDEPVAKPSSKKKSAKADDDDEEEEPVKPKAPKKPVFNDDDDEEEEWTL
jgi:hypothetical protein